MAIDESGEWWIGSVPQDMKEYITALSQDNYPIDDFRISKCICGSIAFVLELDKNEGCAKRTCVDCHHGHFLCDSKEYWEDAEPEHWSCIACDNANTNVGVGYAFRSGGEVRWLYIINRCCSCGVLGCYADWKIDYSPSIHLIEQA